jgi:hypothetical protein
MVRGDTVRTTSKGFGSDDWEIVCVRRVVVGYGQLRADQGADQAQAKVDQVYARSRDSYFKTELILKTGSSSLLFRPSRPMVRGGVLPR